MMNDTQAANLARSRHMSAAIAIAELCNRRHLPAVHEWKIKRDRIIVQLLPVADESLHGIGVWSREFGGARPHLMNTWMDNAHVAVNFEYRGLRFHVWTAMRLDEVPAAWAAPADSEVPA